MNSTTGDFTEIRRSSVEIDTHRISQSVVKKRPRVPRKIVNLIPLNLNEIRKELEEGDKVTEKVIFNTIDNEKEESQVLRKIDDNSEDFKLKSLTDITNKHVSKVLESARTTPFNKIHVQNTVNTPLNKKTVPKATKNDSFDLNFSALSLVTPVKKLESTYVTPQVKKSDIINSKNSETQFEDFVTPSINRNGQMKIQYSALKTTHHNKHSTLQTPLLEEKDKDLLSEKKVSRYGQWNNFDNDLKPIDIHHDCFGFERLQVKDVEYLVLNALGKGGSSEVFACFCPKDKKHVAIKCVSLQNQVNAIGYINEVKLLHKLQNCEKIITMYDYEILESEKKLLVVLEKGGEDLSTILKNIAAQKSHVPFYMLFFYWMEMLYAVQQIHSHGIIHSDLKPANFLKADSGLKLIDFGIASSVQVDMTSVFKTTQEGSCNYISPEALNPDAINPSQHSPNNGSAKYKLHYKSDVWSLGCILYQLVYRRTPFHHLHSIWTKLAYIVNPDHVIEFPDADWVPPKIIDTIKKCLQYDVKSRPTVDELISDYESFWCNNCFSSTQRKL